MIRLNQDFGFRIVNFGNDGFRAASVGAEQDFCRGIIENKVRGLGGEQTAARMKDKHIAQRNRLMFMRKTLSSKKKVNDHPLGSYF